MAANLDLTTSAKLSAKAIKAMHQAWIEAGEPTNVVFAARLQYSRTLTTYQESILETKKTELEAALSESVAEKPANWFISHSPFAYHDLDKEKAVEGQVTLAVIGDDENIAKAITEAGQAVMYPALSIPLPA